MTAESRAKLRAQIVQHEGMVLSAYQDSEGYWTIGVGRLIDQRRGGGISEAEAMLLLDNDLARVEQAVYARWPWVAWLSDVRQRVILDMAFNLGLDGLAHFTATLTAVQAGAYEAAADQMLKSLWAKQVKGRAVRLAEMMRTGKDDV